MHVCDVSKFERIINENIKTIHCSEYNSFLFRKIFIKYVQHRIFLDRYSHPNTRVILRITGSNFRLVKSFFRSFLRKFKMDTRSSLLVNVSSIEFWIREEKKEKTFAGDRKTDGKEWEPRPARKREHRTPRGSTSSSLTVVILPVLVVLCIRGRDLVLRVSRSLSPYEGRETSNEWEYHTRISLVFGVSET